MAAEFVSYLSEVQRTTKEALEKAAEMIGGAMETHAKEHVTDEVYASPGGWYVRTGNLRNSITHDTEDSDGEMAVIVGSGADYGIYVEMGTGVYAEGGGRATPWRYQDAQGNWHTTTGMPPRPFIRPAVENHIPEYKEILEEVLGRA